MSGVVNSRKPVVMGGKLKLKGSSGGGASKQPKRSSESAASSSSGADNHHETHDERKADNSAKASAEAVIPGGEYMTASQRRHAQRKIEMEKLEAKKLSKTSFRDRVDQFNNKLAQMTEHNDIPRISAAGNG